MAALLLLFLAAVVIFIVLITKAAEITSRLRSLEERVARISEALSETGPHARASAQEAPQQADAKPQPYAPPETVPPPAAPVQPATDVEPPAPPRPIFVPPPPPPPSRTREEWEALIGGKLLNRIGALALVIGIGFFLKYAFDNNWLSETMRVLIGAAAGFLLLAGAARSRKRGLLIFSQGLVGAGVAVLYLSVYASFNYYHLVSQPVAFILMAFVTVIAFTQAFLYDSIAVSLLGWAGGFLTPFMLSTGEPNEIGLFSYVALLAAGLLVVVMKKERWAVLEPLTLAATYFIYFLWYSQEYAPDRFAATLFFAILFWALFFVVDTVNSARRFADLRELRSVAGAFNAALFYLALLLLINTDHHAWMGATTLALGVAYGAGALAVVRQAPQNQGDFARLMVISIILLVVAPAIEFERFTIVMYWAVEALVLAWAGRRWNVSFATYLSFALHILALCVLLMLEGAALTDPALLSTTMLFNMRAAAFALLAVCLGLSGLLYASTPDAPGERPSHFKQGAASFVYYGSCFLLFLLATVETNDQFRRLMIGTSGMDLQSLSFQRYMTEAVVWAALAIVFVWLGRKRSFAPLLFSGMIIMFFAMSMAGIRGIAYESLARFDPVVNSRTLAMLLVIAGAFAVTAWLATARTFPWIEESADVMRVFAVVLILALLTGETIDFFQQKISLVDPADSNAAADSRALQNMKQLSLSGIWLLYSICLMGVGIWRHSRSLRVIAIVVFGITILKIFIYDLSFLETLYRIFSFIGLGLVLLLVSYLYQHYRDLIFEERPKEEAETEETPA